MQSDRASRTARRLAAVLLAGTCLTAVGLDGARADGGNGGTDGLGSGGAGGPGFTATNGGNGTTFSGGGGGAAGGPTSVGTGGAGGLGGGPQGGAAGLGGTTGSHNGGNGGNGSGVSGGGGGGGGGGFSATSATLTNSGAQTGGNGGTGGTAILPLAGGGGGGGGGGYGAIVTGAGASSNTGGGAITGGTGDTGGSGFGATAFGGNGGDGGVGVQFTTSGASFTNSGTVTGGNGGAGGGISGGSTAGTAGSGGAGVVGSALSITNSGTITGGTGNGGQANAITFTGGANTLTLQNGFSLTGDIALQAGTLTFNQSTNQTLGNSIIGAGSVIQNGPGTLTLAQTNFYTGATTINAGTLALAGGIIATSSVVTVNGGATFDISNNGGFVAISTLAGSGTVQLGGNGLAIFNGSTEFSGAINGSAGLEIEAGTQTLSGVNGYTNATQIDTGATLALKGNGSIASSAFVGFAPLFAGAATLDISQTNSGTSVGVLFDIGGVGVISLGSKTLTITNGGTFNGVIADGGIAGGTGGGLTVAGNELDLGGVNTYTGPTTIAGGAILALLSPGSIAASSGVNLVGAGATFDISGSGTGQTIKDLSGVAGSTVALGSFALTVGSANSTTFAGVIADGGLSGGTGGSLIKTGGGTLTLTGANTYTGGTTINGGLINFSALNNFGTGMITLAGGGLQWAAGNTIDISSRLVLGAAGATFDTGGNNVTFATGLGGAGGIAKQGLGTLTLGGTNTFTGGTILNAGGLTVNGSLASGVTVNAGNLLVSGTVGSSVTMNGGSTVVNGRVTGAVTVNAGTLGGNGTIGGLTMNGGIVGPGNSIGTLNVVGNFVQNAGSIYQVEANAAGQADRINATGTAAINGGTVQVLAQPGNYANSTTYTILRANGGVSGVYSGVSSNFAFLTPTLSYDANDVFLTLSIAQNAFTPSFVALTPNQRAVGIALNQSFANASGDFATVIGALAGLSTQQGPIALDTISGQPYADFGTMNTNSSMMFMNALGQQMANARSSSASTGQRQALARACEIESCDVVGPLSAWASALGGLGSVLGDGNASTLTYNFGGAAAGIDYRLDPRFLVGIGTGYTHGTQWVNSFMGQGWSDSVSVAAYGSFTQSNFCLDALAGYAYFNNQLQRQILIPGLQQRTATGSTGANQFLGQAEGGYKVGVYAPAAATITPFGRLQISSVTQNAFSESGAQSLSLNVAQQTTNSLRTTIGADLASSIELGNERKLDVAIRLGWQHELADTGRPITAAFAGAPGNSFTVFGATPTRDAAVVGFQATTTIAQATQVYLRYDGGVGGGTDNHAINVGLRMSW